MERLALMERTSVPKLIAAIDHKREALCPDRSLASAIRVHCLLNAVK